MESEAVLTDRQDFWNQSAESQISIKEILTKFNAKDKMN
jgi:hypothetical protein